LKTLSASYFVELLNKVSESDTPIKPLYDLLKRALEYLDESEPTLLAIEHYEKEMARILGILNPERPSINALSDICKVPLIRSEILKLLK
jgi:DNA repair protein RecO (recombination protein O)